MSATAGDLEAPNPPMPGALTGVMLSKKSFIAVDWVNSLDGKDNVLGAVPPAGEDEITAPQPAAHASWTGAKMPATKITMIANTNIRPISYLSFLLS
jgi:hypothetical protein